jgi:hypothetical protein
MAREVVRQVQELRKKSSLEMEDRIALFLHTDSPQLREAIERHQTYICSETLASRWETQSLDGDSYQATVKVDGQPLRIELRRVPAAGS